MTVLPGYSPHLLKNPVPYDSSLEQIEGGYVLTVKLLNGKFTALLPTSEQITLKTEGFQSKGAIKCRLKKIGMQTEILSLEE
jgi:hypothetical protein